MIDQSSFTEGQKNAAYLRSQKVTSTDPDYLERLAVVAENTPDYPMPAFLDRRKKPT